MFYLIDKNTKKIFPKFSLTNLNVFCKYKHILMLAAIVTESSVHLSFHGLWVCFISSHVLLWPGACTMMVAEQTQSFMIRFESTKPNQSDLDLSVPWSWSSTFSVNSGFDPELVEHEHMKVWLQQWTSNHMLVRELLPKIKRLNNINDLNTFTQQDEKIHEQEKLKDCHISCNVSLELIIYIGIKTL